MHGKKARMGWQLIRDAHAQRPNWSITNNAFTVLSRMAITAHDKDTSEYDARYYFGGWKPLALSLGYQVEAAELLPPDAKRAVARALRELIDQGLIKPGDDNQHAGRRHRNYILTY